MKSLVTGSAGVVGRQVAKDLSELGQVYSCYHRIRPDFGTPVSMDLLHDEDIRSVISQTRPDVIFHCAALGDLEICEKEKDLANRINHHATETISREADRLKSFLVYVSTDYVFDGTKGMRRESDVPNPINHYGRTKLEGENAVQGTASKWCIARTSVVYGTHPTRTNAVASIIDSLQNGRNFFAPVDQYICPTYLQNLSRMIIEMGTRQIAGIIHLCGATKMSRYEAAKTVAAKFSLDTKYLVPSKISDMKNWTAKRPQDSSLDTSKAKKILKEKPLGFNEGLDLYARQLKART